MSLLTHREAVGAQRAAQIAARLGTVTSSRSQRDGFQLSSADRFAIQAEMAQAGAQASYFNQLANRDRMNARFAIRDANISARRMQSEHERRMGQRRGALGAAGIDASLSGTAFLQDAASASAEQEYHVRRAGQVQAWNFEQSARSHTVRAQTVMTGARIAVGQKIAQAREDWQKRMRANAQSPEKPLPTAAGSREVSPQRVRLQDGREVEVPPSLAARHQVRSNRVQRGDDGFLVAPEGASQTTRNMVEMQNARLRGEQEARERNIREQAEADREMARVEREMANRPPPPPPPALTGAPKPSGERPGWAGDGSREYDVESQRRAFESTTEKGVREAEARDAQAAEEERVEREMRETGLEIVRAREAINEAAEKLREEEREEEEKLWTRAGRAIDEGDTVFSYGQRLRRAGNPLYRDDLKRLREEADEIEPELEESQRQVNIAYGRYRAALREQKPEEVREARLELDKHRGDMHRAARRLRQLRDTVADIGEQRYKDGLRERVKYQPLAVLEYGLRYSKSPEDQQLLEDYRQAEAFVIAGHGTLDEFLDNARRQLWERTDLRKPSMGQLEGWFIRGGRWQ